MVRRARVPDARTACQFTRTLIEALVRGRGRRTALTVKLRSRGRHLCKASQRYRVQSGRLARIFGKASMARKPQVAVEPRPGGRWAVQTDGTSRADSLHDRQSDAIKRARELAKNKETELVIKGEDGRIRKKDSEGNDPRGRG
jgi:hypothetical protein